MTAYPNASNGAAVSRGEIGVYFDTVFRHVDWGEGGILSILGIGEKGTPQEGVFRERKFIACGPSLVADMIWPHAVRWAQHEIATFIVPAVIHPAAQLAGDVTLDKIKAFTAFVIDFDNGDPAAGLAHAETHIGPATMVVASGGLTPDGKEKLHGYWRFTEPTTEIATVAALRKIAAAKCGGDQAFGRATQVIRIAGSLHCKSGGAKPVRIIRVTDAEYELADLVEAVETMGNAPGVEVSVPVTPPMQSIAGFMDFSGGAGKSSESPVMGALTTPIAEGGDGDGNRWLNFSRVAGLEIANARRGLQTLDQARELTLGWMMAKMEPPWPQARFLSEWAGILREDAKNNGPMLAAVAPPASAGERAAEKVGTADELLSWAVHRRSSPTPPARRILVEGLIFAGKRHMIVAEGGAGKTFLCMELALKLAASGAERDFTWLGQAVRPEAHGGTVILMTGEDDLDELDIRWSVIDPGGSLRQLAGDKLIALPLDNLGGAFPLVSQHPHTREAVASPKWAALYEAMRGIVDGGGRISAVIIDTLNSTLHGEENSAMVIGEYVRAVAPICGELKAALIVTHHVRKAGTEPIRTMEDMRDAIRGSTALPNAMRLVVGVWAAHDYERRMKAMRLTPQRATLFRAGVIKANMPEALREAKTLLRDRAGLLQDVTMQDTAARGGNPEARTWLVWAVKRAADMRAPLARSMANGVYARRSQLPSLFHNMTRDGDISALIEDLLNRGDIILRPVENGGNTHQYLDVPECKNTPRFIDKMHGLDLGHERFHYDHGWDEIRENFSE